MTDTTSQMTVSLIIDPAFPGTVYALAPNDHREGVENWNEVVKLLHRYGDIHNGDPVLAVDPQQAEQITRILNGKP